MCKPCEHQILRYIRCASTVNLGFHLCTDLALCTTFQRQHTRSRSSIVYLSIYIKTMSDNRPRTIIPTLNIIPPNTPPAIYASAHAYFTSKPWTSGLLSQADTHGLIIQARNPLNSSIDQLFSSTLNHEDRVPHMLSFFTATPQQISDPSYLISEVSTLYPIGHRLTGGPGMLHGGITSALVDEGMGAVTEVNNVLGKDGESFQGMSCVTGELKIRFMKPILTGDIVRVRSRLIKSEGRRCWIECTVEDESEDVLAKAESIWIAPRERVGREML